MAKANNTPKPYHVSYSKLSSFRRCLQRYQWNYIEKYFPPSGIGQTRGTCGHAALASWHVDYDAPKAMQIAWETWEQNGYNDGSSPDWLMLEEAMNRYFIYSKANDTFTMVSSEQKFDIEYELPSGEPIIFTGYIDGIIQDGDQQWLMEHKFLKQVDNGTKDLDHQSSLYLLAAHRLGYKVAGVVYNQIRMGSKIAEKEPVLRRKVVRNTAGLEHIEQELLAQVQTMQKFEREGGEVYRNPTKDCGWDCAFLSACLSLQDDGQPPSDILKQIVTIRSNDNGQE